MPLKGPDLTQTPLMLEAKQLLKNEVDILKTKYPSHVPVIVTSKDKSIKLQKQKYLVNTDITIGQFMFMLRKRIDLEPQESLYLFVNKVLPPSSSQMSLIYDSYKDDVTGMMFMNLCKENTFGHHDLKN